MKNIEKENNKQKKKLFQTVAKVTGIFLLVLVVLGAGVMTYILKSYSLDKIQVTGNIHYTEQEIIAIITEEKNTDNTLLFCFEDKLHPVENITFVDKYNIERIDKHTVTITIYEKSMAGCVKYMDNYVYFDNEGTVLETSIQKLPDVPCIQGIKFDNIVVGEKLPVKNKDVFSQILTITQLIEKNDLIIDEIRFNSNEDIYLYKNDIKIELGQGAGLEDKLMNLENILEKLEGKKGTLDLKEYDATSGNAIFKEN